MYNVYEFVNTDTRYGIILLIILVVIVIVLILIIRPHIHPMVPTPDPEMITRVDLTLTDKYGSIDERSITTQNGYKLIELMARAPEFNEEYIFPYQVFVIGLDRKPERYEDIKTQLVSMKMPRYQRWSAVDGFSLDAETLVSYGVTEELAKRPGLAGCAASHINVLKHIRDNKIDWALVLEDDAHFHPNFLQLFKQYWNQVPKDAYMVYPGHCGSPEEEKKTLNPNIPGVFSCTHAYMTSWEGAAKILDSIIPVTDPIDITFVQHFMKEPIGSAVAFNGNALINGIRPNDYKDQNGDKCEFNGIIYQNQRAHGSTIHKPETVYYH